jgi:ophiobolin F synthase
MQDRYRFWHALIVFGCAITIPEHETDLCHQLALPAIMSVTLTNDLFSYDKEYDAAKKAGRPESVVNALQVLMDEHKVSLDEAKVLCRQRNKVEVAKCVQATKETRARSDVSQQLKDYMYHMQFGVSGNAIWSVHCRRYHPDAPFNDRQKALLEQYFPDVSEDSRQAPEALKDTRQQNTSEQSSNSKQVNNEQNRQNYGVFNSGSPSVSEVDSGIGDVTYGGSKAGSSTPVHGVAGVEDWQKQALKPAPSLKADVGSDPRPDVTNGSLTEATGSHGAVPLSQFSAI